MSILDGKTPAQMIYLVKAINAISNALVELENCAGGCEVITDEIGHSYSDIQDKFNALERKCMVLHQPTNDPLDPTMIVLLRNSGHVGKAVAIYARSVEHFADRVEVNSINDTHHSISVDYHNDAYTFDGETFDFMTVYSRALLPSLVNEFGPRLKIV